MRAVAVVSDWRMSRVIRQILLATFCLAFIAGCTVPTHVILFNGLSNDIVLVFKNEDRRIENVTVKTQEKVEVKRLLDMEFSIRSGASTVKYAMEMVPESFIEHVGFGPFFKRVVKAQLANDGCIYLVAIQYDLPVHELETQPENFPLCPKS